MKIHWLVATFFGLGKISPMPGTLGSIIAFPLYFLLIVSTMLIHGGMSSPVSPTMTNYMLLMICILFLIGTWASNHYIGKNTEDDPKEIIIDEITGQLLTITIIISLLPVDTNIIKFVKKIGYTESTFIYFSFACAFILFRLFDILKPWPIKSVEHKVKGGLGIMLDDIVAATMASCCYYFILYVIMDIYN